ncbi:stalk domain-containing protein [Bacillus tianshenii]|nr:stalk domain-containing protein [Bacillus tianshenii]
MFKRVLGVLLLFTFLIAGLVGYQWIVYQRGESAEAKEQTIPLRYELSILHNKSGLKVEQTIRNIEQQQFLVQLPEGISDVSCSYDSKSECDWTDSDKGKRLNVQGAPKVTFTYTLPLAPGAVNQWFEKWYVQFLNNELKPYVADMSVTVSEELNKSTVWAAGAVNKADVKRDYLRFYAWEKENATEFPLYMSNEQLAKSSKGKVLTYTSPNAAFHANGKWVENLPEQTGLTLVTTTQSTTHLSPLLAVLPAETAQMDADEKMAYAYFLEAKRPSNEGIRWIWDAFPSLAFNKNVADGKAREMVEELLGQLNKQEKKAFAQWLYAKSSEKVSVKDLDEALSHVTEKETKFFSSNAEATEPLQPLYFVEERDVYYKGKKISQNWKPIYQKGGLYLPLVDVVEKAGFEVTELEGEDTYIVQKGGNTWRLFLKESYFIFNQEDYGLTSKPLEKVNGRVYMSEKWFEQLLRVEIIKRDDGIHLK